MKVKNYTVILRSEPEGGYTAIVPSLPGCVTYGETIEEAKNMVKDAIEGYLVSLKKHGEEIPEEVNVFTTSVFANA
jgi:antitoxin HicB